MAFEIIAYSFEKKANSTKRVTIQDAIKNTRMPNCEIKMDGCGIVTPVIRIAYGLIEAPVNFNYVYIPVFERYYFVVDWKSSEGLWEAQLQEDFLATWRHKIMDYEAYVLRSASRYDTTIPDMAYTATSKISVSGNDIPNPFNAGNEMGELVDDGGYYVVGISGANDTPYASAGSVTYYVFSAISMQSLCNFLMANIDYLDIDWESNSKKFMTPELLKCLFNPLQYIASCRWYPYFPRDKGTDVNRIKFGFWEVEAIGRMVTTRELVETEVRNIPVPKHPQSASYGSWCNLAPYTTYQLHVAPYGIMDVPADELINSSNCAVETVIDFATGQARMMVAAAGIRFVQIANFMFGCDVQISQLVQDGLKATLSGLQYNLQHTAGYNLRQSKNLGSMALGNLSSAADMGLNMVGDVEAGLSFIGDLASAMSPTIQSQGSNGARAWYYTGEGFWRLSGKFTQLTPRGDGVLGRPLCQMARLGDLSGYCLCENASLSFEGNSVEQTVVNGYLNRGFYLE